MGVLETVVAGVATALLAEIGKDAYHELKRWNTRRHRPKKRVRSR